MTTIRNKTWIRFYRDGKYVDEITFADAEQRVRNKIDDLKNIGLKRGDVVIVQMPNCIEAVITYLSLFPMGIIAVPVHPKEPELRLEYIKKDSGAKGVFHETGYESYQDAAETKNIHPRTDTVIYTSGTTGDPKGVCLSFQKWDDAGQDMIDVNGFDESTVYGGPLPLYHCAGFGVSMIASFFSGATLILFDGVTENFLDIVNAEKITVVGLVPAFLFKLFQENPNWKPHDKFKYFISSASYLDPVLLRNILKNWGTKVYQGYGLTEVTHFSTFLRPELSDSEYESIMFPEPSVGYALPSAEIKLDPETNEILIKTPNTLIGYFGKETFCGEWFATGDVGFEKEINGKRFLYIKGRIKEIINRAGEKINPIEIENEIRNLGFEKEFAIFSIPDSQYGEEVGIATLQQIDVSIFSKLPSQIRPKKNMVVTEIPKTHTGKVQRGKLKSHFENYEKT